MSIRKQWWSVLWCRCIIRYLTKKWKEEKEEALCSEMEWLPRPSKWKKQGREYYMPPFINQKHVGKDIHLGTDRARLLNPGDRASYLTSTIVKETLLLFFFFFCLSAPGTGVIWIWWRPPSLCPHMVEKKRQCVLWCLFFKRHSFSYGGPTLMTSSIPNYLAKAPSSNSITLGIRASTCEFEGDTIQWTVREGSSKGSLWSSFLGEMRGKRFLMFLPLGN